MIVSCSLAQMWEERIQKMTLVNFFFLKHILLKNFLKANYKREKSMNFFSFTFIMNGKIKTIHTVYFASPRKCSYLIFTKKANKMFSLDSSLIFQ